MDTLLSAPEFIVFALGVIVGSIIWFVRLEGRVNQGEKTFDQDRIFQEKERSYLRAAGDLAHKRIEEIKRHHDEMESRIFQEMGNIKVSLAEISGYLRKEKESK